MSDTEIVVDEEFAAALNKERDWVFKHLAQVLEEHDRLLKRTSELYEAKQTLQLRLTLIDRLLTVEKVEDVPY